MAFLKWRRPVNRLHLILGLVAAAPLVVLGVTGALLVFETELDLALSPGVWYVEPQPGRLSYQEQFDRVRAADPDLEIQAVFLPLREDLACVFAATGEGGGQPQRIHVDPYTGTILGRRAAWSTPMGFIRILHTHFLLRWGNYIGGVASLVLLVLLGSGLVLWWPTGKDKAAGLKIKAGRHWRRTNYDAHRALGFYTAPILLLIALTGVVFTFPEVMRPLIY